MDLKRKYAQLFEGKLRSNDKALLTEGTTPQFKRLIKRAKQERISTADELYDLIANEFSDDEITGADYEEARKILRIRESVNVIKEGDMTRQYDGFIVGTHGPGRKKVAYKFRYIKGRNSVDIENIAIQKVMKAENMKRADLWVTGTIKKGQWNQSTVDILETIVKEANEIPLPEDIISDGMAEVDRVIDELLDLEQSVMSSIEMYQEETGDLRFEQILNQGARYIQSAQRNLQYLHKMLKRNL